MNDILQKYHLQLIDNFKSIKFIPKSSVPWKSKKHEFLFYMNKGEVQFNVILLLQLATIA